MMTRNVFRAVSAVFLVFLASTLVFGQSDRVKQDLASSFSRFDAVRISNGSAQKGQARSLSFTRKGKQVEIPLEANDMRGANYRAVDTGSNGDTPVGRGEITTFKGSVAGDADSVARFNVTDAQYEGFYRSNGEILYVEPASNYSRAAAQDEYVIYRMEDAKTSEAMECMSQLGQKIEAVSMAAATAIPAEVGAVKQLEIATEADAEFVSRFGGASQANTEILGILNVIDGIYRNDLSVSISVVYQHTWTSPDPFAGASSPDILTAFQNYWETNFTSVARDTTHLFSAKSNVAGQGIAFMGSVCRFGGSAAYGLSGYVGWAPGKYLLTAHEIGHNLGGEHVDAAQSCASTIMNPSLSYNTASSFCAYSKNELGTFITNYGSCLSSNGGGGGAPTPGCKFDFDGDRKADISVFRPGNGTWYQQRSATGFQGFQFGQAGDRTVAADYDGDGKTDAAVFRNGVWYRLMSATGTFDGVSFGSYGDIPAPADVDGDGKADLVTYRPSTGTWFETLSSTGGFSAVQFGTAGDVPLPADFDADGKADLNVFRPSNGTWYRMLSATGTTFGAQFGISTDKPLVGDFDGDARADSAVFRPATGAWYILRANNSFTGTNFGTFGDIPVPADYDGDGKADIAVFRPSTGTWYRLDSSTGAFNAYNFGISTDQPTPAASLP